MNVSIVGVGRVGVCMLCVGDSEDRGVGAETTIIIQTTHFCVYYESINIFVFIMNR